MKEHALELIEVTDNGSGAAPPNFAAHVVKLTANTIHWDDATSFVYKQISPACVQSRTWRLFFSQTDWLCVSMHTWLWLKYSR